MRRIAGAKSRDEAKQDVKARRGEGPQRGKAQAVCGNCDRCGVLTNVDGTGNSLSRQDYVEGNGHPPAIGLSRLTACICSHHRWRRSPSPGTSSPFPFKRTGAPSGTEGGGEEPVGGKPYDRCPMGLGQIASFLLVAY